VSPSSLYNLEITLRAERESGLDTWYYLLPSSITRMS